MESTSGNDSLGTLNLDDYSVTDVETRSMVPHHVQSSHVRRELQRQYRAAMRSKLEEDVEREQSARKYSVGMNLERYTFVNPFQEQRFTCYPLRRTKSIDVTIV